MRGYDLPDYSSAHDSPSPVSPPPVYQEISDLLRNRCRATERETSDKDTLTVENKLNGDCRTTVPPPAAEEIPLAPPVVNGEGRINQDVTKQWVESTVPVRVEKLLCD